MLSTEKCIYFVGSMTEQILRSVQQTIVETIKSLYGEDEATAISYHLLEDLLGVSRGEILSDSRGVSVIEQGKIQQALQRLLNHEPLQYVTGKAHFYGLQFKVNRHVLIPRPETEELVQLILQSPVANRTSPSILDIGTGSGCIPIAIKKNLPAASVFAIDISADALTVAKENAAINKVEVPFIEADILGPGMDQKIPQQFDVIVSNPPYITHNERHEMQSNVLEHEPHLALFVPDNDPLLFYKAITGFATRHLQKDGSLYFEINAAYGNEVASYMIQQGFTVVQVIKDMQGKDRMVRGILN